MVLRRWVGGLVAVRARSRLPSERAGRPTGARAHHTSATVSEVGRKARRRANEAAGKGRRAGRKANKAAQRAGHQANRAVSDAAKSGVTFATPYVRHANESAAGAARAALDSAAPYVSAGVERAGELIAKASEHLPS